VAGREVVDSAKQDFLGFLYMAVDGVEFCAIFGGIITIMSSVMGSGVTSE